MTVLLIKPMHIGDALLMTPTVRAIRETYPTALIVVVVRDFCQGILDGCGDIDEILLTKSSNSTGGGLARLKSIVGLIFRLRAFRADYAFELGDNSRGFWLTGFSGAQRRCINDYGNRRRHWWHVFFSDVYQLSFLDRHRAQKDHDTVAHILPLTGNIDGLVFERDRCRLPDGFPIPGRFVVMHPTTRWKRKSWPAENWVALGRILLERGYQIILSCGPQAEEIRFNDELVRALGAQTQSTQGRLSWAGLASLLYQAELFLGVDTAAMHLAAACRCPTVALFGATKSESWGPWMVDHEIVHPDDDGGETSLVGTAKIAVGQVIDAIDRLNCRDSVNRENGSTDEPRLESTEEPSQTVNQ